MIEGALISVITPFYNVSDFLKETIESVLHQTYTHWELLLIDDGSFDGSSEIAIHYKEAYPDKIYYLQHDGKANRGTSASRNLGVSNAKGEYIALLDADDYWLPDKLTFQVSIIRKNPQASMICGATLYWESWLNNSKADIIIPVGGQQNELIFPPSAALTLYPLGDGAAPCLCSILLKKEIMLRYHGFEESFTGLYQFYEDQAFLIKIYLHEPIFISSEMKDYYRQRKNSNMSLGEDPEKYKIIRQYFLDWLKEYCKKEKTISQAVRKRVQKAISQNKNLLLFRMRAKIKRMIKR